jgi:hypothetical protein
MHSAFFLRTAFERKEEKALSQLVAPVDERLSDAKWVTLGFFPPVLAGRGPVYLHSVQGWLEPEKRRKAVEKRE